MGCCSSNAPRPIVTPQRTVPNGSGETQVHYKGNAMGPRTWRVPGGGTYRLSALSPLFVATAQDAYWLVAAHSEDFEIVPS